VTYELNNGNKLDLNANVINVGDASVDTPSLGGQVVGENDDPCAVMVELTYHI
jgi:hypothetical protein